MKAKTKKTTKVWKLTDENGQTQNSTQWGENVTHTADGKSKKLCNGHWIHAYQDPLLAVLMNPVHSAFLYPQLWECKAKVGRTEPDKLGCTSLTTIRRIALPIVTTEQRVKFGCMAAREVYDFWKQYDKDGAWLKWYDSGCPAYAASDATHAAYAAARAASDAANAAYAAYAASDATYAAYAAARAASDAAYATHASDAANAAYAAYAAARAASDTELDLVAIARKVVTENEARPK